MKRILFLFLTLCLLNGAEAQVFDYGHPLQQTRALTAPDGLGGYYSVGRYTSDYQVDPNDPTDIHPVTFSSFCFKHIDADGQLARFKIVDYDDSWAPLPKRMTSNAAGEFFIYYAKGNGEVDISLSDNHTYMLSTDYFIAKYTRQGLVMGVSDRLFFPSEHDLLAASPDGGLYAHIGVSRNAAIDIDGEPGLDVPVIDDRYGSRRLLIRFDPQMNIDWLTNRDYTSTLTGAYAHGHKMVVKSDNSVVVKEEITNEIHVEGFGDFTAPFSNRGAVITQVAIDGTLEHFLPIEKSGTSQLFLDAMAVDSQNRLAISGFTQSQTDMALKPNSTTLISANQAYLALYDNDFELLSVKARGGAGSIIFKHLVFDENSELHGLANSPNSADPYFGSPSTDDQSLMLSDGSNPGQVVYVKFDSGLAPLNARWVGGADNRPKPLGLWPNGSSSLLMTLRNTQVDAPLDGDMGEDEVLIPSDGANSDFMVSFELCSNTEEEYQLIRCGEEAFVLEDGEEVDIDSPTAVIYRRYQSDTGCDRIVRYDLATAEVGASEETISVCAGSAHVFPDGSEVDGISEALTYTSTLTAVSGCDSLVTTTIEVRETEESTEHLTLCAGESYTFPDGVTVEEITEDMERTSAITGTNGCAAFVTTTIEVLETESTIDFISVCEGEEFTFPDGTYVPAVTQAFSHVSVVDATNGCDSTITTHLSVFESEDMEETVTLCRGESYTFPDGTNMDGITEDLTYYSTIQTDEGCDMEVATTIEVIEMDVNLTETAAGLETDLVADSYQWLVCGDEHSPIVGATSATFMPSASGDYALSTTVDGCTFTSDCVTFIISSVEENELSRSISCYPNPATEQVIIDLSRLDDRSGLTLRLLDLSGRQVMSRVVNESDGQMIELPLNVSSGSYLLTFSTGELSTTERLIVK